jgi:hypothetical protein
MVQQQDPVWLSRLGTGFLAFGWVAWFATLIFATGVWPVDWWPSGGSVTGGLVFIIFAIACYLIPTLVALMRDVPNTDSVVVINFFLGWTFIGWVVPLAMAMRSNAALSKTGKTATRSAAARQGGHAIGAPLAKTDTPARSTQAKTATRSASLAKTDTPARSTPPSSPLSGWPPNAEPYYRPTLIAAIAASVGVMIGTIGPWVTSRILSIAITGLDDENWGIATLTLGAVSCLALLTVLFWPRTPFNPRWAAPLAWAVVVAGVACLTFALPSLIRIMTGAKAHFLGLSIGPGVGWGLWLLAFASAVLCVAASIVAKQLAEGRELLQTPGQSDISWTNGWRWAAIIASAIIAVSGIVYFGTHWDNDSGGRELSPTQLPSFPSFPSFTGPSSSTSR